MKLIYFLRNANGEGPIKIGCSGWPTARAHQISIDLRAKFDVLAKGPGDFTTERNLHQKFADARVAEPFTLTHSRITPIGGLTEWFHPVPELLVFIDRVRCTGCIELGANERREVVFADRYLAGESLQKIGAAYGLSRQRIHQILSQHGYPTNPKARRTFPRRLLPDAEAEGRGASTVPAGGLA